MTDPVLRQLTALRPPTAADPGWAASPEGQRLLRAAQRTARHGRPRRRRVWIAAVSGAAVLGGGAVAVAAVSGQAPTDRHLVLCNETAALDADGAGLTLQETTPAAAAAACSADWERMFPGVTKPVRFAVCVYPATPGQSGGGQVALPAAAGTTDEQVCADAGTVPAR